MKIAKGILILAATTAAPLSGFAALHSHAQGASEFIPETVLVTYHVQAGKEAEFQDLLARTWAVYQSEQLVESQPHVVVRGKDAAGKPFFTEVLTWVSASAPDHVPDSIKTLWQQEGALCKLPDGKNGIDGAVVQVVMPSH